MKSVFKLVARAGLGVLLGVTSVLGGGPAFEQLTSTLERAGGTAAPVKF